MTTWHDADPIRVWVRVRCQANRRLIFSAGALICGVSLTVVKKAE
jgi:hypothetical protein